MPGQSAAAGCLYVARLLLVVLGPPLLPLVLHAAPRVWHCCVSDVVQQSLGPLALLCWSVLLLYDDRLALIVGAAVSEARRVLLLLLVPLHASSLLVVYSFTLGERLPLGVLLGLRQRLGARQTRGGTRQCSEQAGVSGQRLCGQSEYGVDEQLDAVATVGGEIRLPVIRHIQHSGRQLARVNSRQMTQVVVKIIRASHTG